MIVDLIGLGLLAYVALTLNTITRQLRSGPVWTSSSFTTVNTKLDTIINKEVQMAGELDQLETDVTALTTVADSAIALLNGLNAALKAAIASGDMTRVAAVNATLEAKTTALATAVTANTPAAP